jgi:lipopolysaccharide transport system ATP-binding protein
MHQPTIKVEGLWKSYDVEPLQQRRDTLYDLLTHNFNPLRWGRGGNSSRASAKEFWALNDVSFQVEPGEVVGVVGRNGAGKSTLLKILSRITAPTRGRIELRGRLASLLEVGTGFHPELSGRENIYLNGTILGMTNSEINRNLDNIVAFAEIEQFLDTPVKRYSSGMYVRLAFAVAAHLDVDVLVVDEVLAVGDGVFQERCLRKMEDVASGGRTVLFVSHNLGAVSRLCPRTILLHTGQVAYDGTTASALGHYSKLSRNTGRALMSGVTGPLCSKAEIRSLELNGSDNSIGVVLQPADKIELKIRGRLLSSLKQFRVTVCIFKDQQLVVGMHDAAQPSDMDACDFESVVEIPSYFLSPGDYSADINMYSQATGEWLVCKGSILFSVATQWSTLYEPGGGMGVVNIRVAGTRRQISETDQPRHAEFGLDRSSINSR